MNSIFIAVKVNPTFPSCDDVIAFKTRDECDEFCSEFEDYEPMGTSVYNLKEARELFSGFPIDEIMTNTDAIGA
jgi:hypothetical protein